MENHKTNSGREPVAQRGQSTALLLPSINIKGLPEDTPMGKLQEMESQFSDLPDNHTHGVNSQEFSAESLDTFFYSGSVPSNNHTGGGKNMAALRLKNSDPAPYNQLIFNQQKNTLTKINTIQNFAEELVEWIKENKSK